MRKITLTLLMTVMGILTANAQWTTDTAVNTLVADSSPTGSQSIGTSTGETYIVWWKSVGAPNNFELRVQLLNNQGEKQFGADGILISSTLPMSTYTVIWDLTIDSKDNLYVGVTGTGAGTECRVYKINIQGQSLWEDGINAGSGYVPTILPLSNDDVIISYMPNTGKGKLQRYNSSGTAIWEEQVDIMPSTAYAANGTVAADMYEHLDGDFTVVFHTRMGTGITSLLFAQRYDEEGVAQWAEPVQLSNQSTAYNNRSYNGVVDGDIVYYGFYTSHDNRFDSYLQKIDADGTTPWGTNGKDFDTNQTYYEMLTNIAFTPGSDYVWAISRYTNSSQGAGGEYVQKFNKTTGERLLTDTAKQVFPVDTNFRGHAGSLCLVNDNPAFIIKSGFDNGASPITINAVFLDGNGDFVLENQILPVATFTASKGDVYLNKPVDGQFVATFTEEKTTGQQKMYAQNFYAPTEMCIPTLTLQNITANVDENGNVNLTGPEFNNGSTDTCGDTSAWTWTITPQTFTCSDLGEQTVTITITNSAGSTATATAAVTITDTEGICTAGLSDYNAQSFAMYPNPANDVLHIRSMEGVAINSVKVYSVLGQELYNTSNTTAAEQLTIPFSNFGTGTYMVSVETASGIYTKQIIKTK